jgi:cbb3-type cytochrome c oxidase subunit III
VSSNEALTIALVILVPAALLWTIFLVRTGRPGKHVRPSTGIPQALRPGQPDEVLEGSRLERIQVWGLVSTVAVAIFIPAYWLPEADKQLAYTEKFAEGSLHRGEIIYNIAETLPENPDPLKYKEIEKSVALGMGCAQCHGPEGEGGTREFTDPVTKEEVTYQVPPLNDVFQRWDDEVVRFTIERGRPGTDMPAWGAEYGGPMTSQMVDDVMAYLHSLPGNQPGAAEPLAEDATGAEIFAARCAVCHGPEGQGKDEEGVYYPGETLWKGRAAQMEEGWHYSTIVNGRRFAFMPQWGEAPAPGVPAPPNPLTEKQIRAVMRYERSL